MARSRISTGVLVPQDATVDVGTPLFVMVDNKADVAAFADFSLDDVRPVDSKRLTAEQEAEATYKAAAAAVSKAMPSPAAAPVAATTAHPTKPSPPGTLAYADLPARFRPKPMSEEEMDAVLSGGAGYFF